MVPTVQQLQSFCEFVTEACTWPCTSYMSPVGLNESALTYVCFTIVLVYLFSSIATCFLRKSI